MGEALIEQWLALTTGDPEYWPVMSQLLAHARYEPGFAALIERRHARYREVHTSAVALHRAHGLLARCLRY